MAFKKSMVKYVILFLVILGFLLFHWKKRNEDHVFLAHKITHAFEKKAKKEFELYSIGSGGSMVGNIKEIEIMFLAFRQVSFSEARELEVQCIEKFVEMINSDKKIRPFLSQYPFKEENVGITVSFREKNRGYYPAGEVSYLFNAKNKLCYYKVDPHSNKAEKIFEEPYEEALRIVSENAKADPDGLKEVIDRLEKKYGFQKINR